VQYVPLRRADDGTLRGLLDAVAPGGTFLFGSHDGNPHAGEYHQREDIAALLGEEWEVLVNETRPRTTPPPEGTRHTHDTVLRAQRREVRPEFRASPPRGRGGRRSP
jgi:hypothetical protein